MNVGSERQVVHPRAMAASLLFSAPGAMAQEKVTVFAAASLKNALDAVNGACEASVGEQATVSYAASSALAKQIQEGAPADIFISADMDWMNKLSEGKLIADGSVVSRCGATSPIPSVVGWSKRGRLASPGPSRTCLAA